MYISTLQLYNEKSGSLLKSLFTVLPPNHRVGMDRISGVLVDPVLALSEAAGNRIFRSILWGLDQNDQMLKTHFSRSNIFSL